RPGRSPHRDGRGRRATGGHRRTALMWDLLITDIAGGGAIAIAGERIAWTGPAREGTGAAAEGWSAGGPGVTPGLGGWPTHLAVVGDRSGEWEQRQAGAGYEDIAAAGGGIMSTVRATRAAGDDELLEGPVARAAALAASGVTTVEVKSG